MLIPDLLRVGRGKDSPNLFIPSSGKEGRHDLAWKVVFMVAIVYSIFLPLKLGTVWAWIGPGMCVIAVGLWGLVIRTILATPPDEPFTGGPYRYSRHPMYVAQAIMLWGIALTTRSWIFSVITCVLIALSLVLALDEEASCVLNFGGKYEEYKRVTPRWLGRPRYRY
jgi:protein-S-isoprenylcysteine O-methyltransferase Ste14